MLTRRLTIASCTALVAALTAPACVRVLDLTPDETDTGAPTTTPPTPTTPPTHPTTPTGPATTPTGGSTGDTGVATTTVCVPGTAPGFRLPSSRWGLAALYASRRLDDRPDSALRLPPAWFLATGWQLTGFGCADYGDPWTVDPRWAGDEGCLSVREDTVWIELCRLWPADHACDAYAGSVAGDAPEASTLALAWFAVAGFALLERLDVDPEPWLDGATDPLAAERFVATAHFWGPWSPQVGAVVETCPDDMVSCLTGDIQRHVDGVSDKLAALADAECFDGPLTAADVRAFVGGLAAARPGRDWVTAEDAAVAALTGAGFAVDAPRVLDAVDAAADLRLACPEQELFEWYRFSCP